MFLGNFSSLTTVGVAPDIRALENAYNSLGRNPESDNVLRAFKEREDAFMYIESLLEQTSNNNVKFIIWQIAEDFIDTRWDTIDEDTKAGFRIFVFTHLEQTINHSPPSSSLTKKIETVGVKIIIQEYPEINPTIVSEIIQMASSQISLENVVQTISFLLEAVLGDDAEDKVKYNRINAVINGLEGNAEDIFTLIKHIFDNYLNKDNLMKSTIRMLGYFIKFIPPQVTVEHRIFEVIATSCIPNQNLISDSLLFIHEVYEQQELSEDLLELAPDVFQIMIDTLAKSIPEDPDFDSLNTVDNFKVKSFTCCIVTFLTKRQENIEIEALVPQITLAIKWIFALTVIDDYLIQKQCIDFWLSIAKRTWAEKANPSAAVEEIYLPLFPDLRRLIIPRMSRPDDFIIDVSGGDVRTPTYSAQTEDLFKSQKGLMVMLTNIDNEDMVDAFGEFFTSLQSQFDIDLFTSLCFGAGAISGTLGAEHEKEFMTLITQFLLELNAESADSMDTRAVISGGLMYVFSQYPRFVASSYQFFRQIIEKLFEFMHSSFPQVREMAVNSFALISAKTAIQFHFTSGEQTVPFITEIIQNFDSIVNELQDDSWIVKFVGSLAKIINQQKSQHNKTEQIGLLMQNFNEQWGNLLANFNPEDEEFTGSMNFVLSCNAVVAGNTKGVFSQQLSLIFSQMMEVYQRYAALLIGYISSIEYDPETDNTVFAYRTVKSNILNILKEYIMKTPDVRANAKTLIPPIMETIIADYEQSDPYSRVPEVLDLVTAMSQNMKDAISDIIPSIFTAVFGTTVEMVKDDFETFLNFRLPFYTFIHVIIKNHIHILLTAPHDQFEYFIDALNWGVRHPYHDVCVEAIAATNDLINGTKRVPQFSSQYVMTIVKHTIEILTDTLHKSAFREQSELLFNIFMNHRQFVRYSEIVDFLCELFPNADGNQFSQYVSELMNSARSPNQIGEFNQILRALLISTKYFSVHDQQIDVEGREAQIAEENQNLEGVEGLNGPAEPIDEVFIE